MSAQFDTYVAYLQSEHWKNLRAEVFILADHKCEACLKSDHPLTGHHIVYRTPLESCVRSDVMCLCKYCHDLFHEWLKVHRRKSHEFDRAETVNRCRKILGGFAKIKKPKYATKHPIVFNPMVWKFEMVARHLQPTEIEHLKEILATRKQSGAAATWNWAIKKLATALNRNLKHLRRSPKGAKALARVEGYQPKLVTPTAIMDARSPRGGWTRDALAKLGVPWPPPKGWKKRLERVHIAGNLMMNGAGI